MAAPCLVQGCRDVGHRIVAPVPADAPGFATGRIDQRAQLHRNALAAGQGQASAVVRLHGVGAAPADVRKNLQGSGEHRIRGSILAADFGTIDPDDPVVSEVDLERCAQAFFGDGSLDDLDELFDVGAHGHSPCIARLMPGLLVCPAIPAHLPRVPGRLYCIAPASHPVGQQAGRNPGGGIRH